MAINTNSAINFLGTSDQLTTSASIVANAVFSVIADTGTWINDDDAPLAMVTFKGTLNISALGGEIIDLYVRKLNVANTTDDDITPDADFKHEFLGSFPMNAGTVQLYTIEVYLPNYKSGSEYEFYIENNSGQQLNAAWELWITPKTIGPHV